MFPNTLHTVEQSHILVTLDNYEQCAHCASGESE